MKIPRNISSELLRIGPSENPSKYPEGLIPRKFPRNISTVYSEELSDELLVLGVSSEIRFLGIPSEISEGFPRKNEFPRSYFRGLVSSVCRRNNVIPTTYRRFFPSVCRGFLVVGPPRMNLELRHDRDPSWLGRELAWNANGLRLETRAASIGS